MATILIVDDEPDIRLLAKLNLERDGHTVRVAEDGQVALDSVAESPPDLVVLDVMMPVLDGFSVLARLKEAGPTSTIPVIMLTALGSPLDRARGGIEGAVRYLAKPVDLAELREAVIDALAEPEAPQRKAAQHHALEMLARLETDPGAQDVPASAPRPRLSALELDRTHSPVGRPRGHVIAETGVADLTDKQRALLQGVADLPTVMQAADHLRMSRSNVYASLRRISRKLGTRDVPQLIHLLRSGQLLPTDR